MTKAFFSHIRYNSRTAGKSTIDQMLKKSDTTKRVHEKEKINKRYVAKVAYLFYRTDATSSGEPCAAEQEEKVAVFNYRCIFVLLLIFTYRYLRICIYLGVCL